MRKLKKLILIIASLSLLTSCIPNYSVEDASMIAITGYDQLDDNQMRGTVKIPQFGRQETGGTIKEKALSASGSTIREIQSKLQSKSNRPFAIGKLSVALYSEEFARNDISDVLDNLSRDARIGRDVYLAVVEGSTKDFLEARYTTTETTSRYITGLIQHNTRGNFPSTNLHHFLYAFYARGMDGFLPLMKKRGDHAEITGIALFKRGVYVHSIPFSKSFIFKIMNENFKEGIQEIPFKNRNVVMENIGSKVKYHVIHDKRNPEFLIEVNITGLINEVESLRLIQSPKIVKEMERVFEKYYTKQCTDLIKEFQEYEVDPIGLGNVLKSRVRDFDNKVWREEYPDAEIKVKVNVDIVETGTSS